MKNGKTSILHKDGENGRKEYEKAFENEGDFLKLRQKVENQIVIDILNKKAEGDASANKFNKTISASSVTSNKKTISTSTNVNNINLDLINHFDKIGSSGEA